MPDDVAKPGEINYNAVDRFTFAHLGAGVGLGLLRVPLWAVVAIALGWELLEGPLKRKVPEVFPHSSQDTAQNAIVDASAVILGSVLVKWIAKHG
jgi:hypothetical protein